MAISVQGARWRCCLGARASGPHHFQTRLPKIPRQLDYLAREVVGIAVEIPPQCERGALVGAGRPAETEVDASREQCIQGTGLLGDDERSVVRQHDAPAAIRIVDVPSVMWPSTPAARQIRSDCWRGVAGVKRAPTGFGCCSFARPATDFAVLGRCDGDGCGRAGRARRSAGVSGGPSCAEGGWRGDGGSAQGRSGGRGARAGVGGHLEEVEPAPGFLASRRMVWATASPRALMRPMAKRLSRVMFVWAVAGAAAVLVEGEVEDVMGGLDAPVPAMRTGWRRWRARARWGAHGAGPGGGGGRRWVGRAREGSASVRR